MWTSREREVPERVAIYLTSELGLVWEKQAGLCLQAEGSKTEGQEIRLGKQAEVRDF